MHAAKNDRGIAIVYVTLFLLVLGLLFVALGVDVGWLAYVRSQGQAAVDAAALRAAAAIPHYNTTKNPDEVYNMASGLNSANTVMNSNAGIAGNNVEFCDGDPNINISCATSKDPAGGVKVTQIFPAPLYFSRLFKGGNSADVTVSSVAWLGGPGEGKPDLPLGLCEEQVGYPKKCSDTTSPPPIWNGSATQSPSPTDNSAWWTPIGYSASASQCGKFVTGKQSLPTLRIGDWVNRNNGQVNGNCLKEVEERFEKCPSTCDTSIPYPDDPCKVILPVFQCDGNPNQQAPITGFAMLCITDVNSQKKDKYVQGPLTCNVTAPGYLGGGPYKGVYPDRAVLVK